MTRQALPIVLALALLGAAPSPLTVYVDGQRLPPTAVVVYAGTIYVTLQELARSLDANVTLDAGRKHATLTTLLRQVTFDLTKPEAVVAGRTLHLHDRARIVRGRVAVPIRSIADSLGATVRFNGTTHEVLVATEAVNRPVGGVPTPAPVPTNVPLNGTVVAVHLADDPPSVDIIANGVSYPITVPAHSKIQFRDTHGQITGEGELGQVQPGDNLVVTLDASGHLRSIADIFAGSSGTIASIAGNAMVLQDGHVVTADSRDVTIIIDGQPSTFDKLSAGDLVSVRSDPKTNKVRLIVALSPGGWHASATATPGPGQSPSGAVHIDAVTDNASRPLRAGQSLHVRVDGTAGGQAQFDLGNVLTGNPMHEVQPGRYEGEYSIQVGTNLVDTPIVVHLTKGGLSAQTVGPDPLNIITTPPNVKSTAPDQSAQINSLRPNIYVTFATVGGKGMDPSSLRLYVNRQDVSGNATRTAGFISYYPGADLAPGTITVQVKGMDVAGNALDYSWTFVIVRSAS